MNIAIFFGGKSVEHDVSVVSAQIVMQGFRALPHHHLIPVYVTPEGRWIVFEKPPSIAEVKKRRHDETCWKLALEAASGKMILETGGVMKKRKIIDLAFPIIHGTNGEDGTLQGLFEMVNVPYVGCGVGASAMGMDKVHQKQVFTSMGIPIVEWMWFMRHEFEDDPEKMLTSVESKLRYPIFIKPANLGSSIGISKATDRDSLRNAIEVAARYDRKIIAERGIENAMEINCAVMGNDNPIASLLEQPISYREFLTFEEKYLTKGGSMKGVKSRVKIPAPVSPEITKKIQSLAVEAYKALDCSGISRVDFFLEHGEKIYVIEINTMPGSLQQHLWKPSGVDLPKLLQSLIDFALERHREKQKNLTFYHSELI